MKTARMPEGHEERVVTVDELHLAAITHELREPVHAALSFLGVLSHERAGPLNEVQRDFLSTAIRALKRLNRRTDDLRLIGTNGNHLSLCLMPINLVELARACVHEMIQVANDYGVSLKLNVLPELTNSNAACLLADPERIDQAVLNILENAIRYAKQGSLIDVNVVRNDSGACGVIVRNAVDHVHLDDTSSWHLPFQRASPDTSKRGNGSGLGLGLTVVDRVILAHGGVVQSMISGNVVSVGFLLPMRTSELSVPSTTDEPRIGVAPVQRTSLI